MRFNINIAAVFGLMVVLSVWAGCGRDGSDLPPAPSFENPQDFVRVEPPAFAQRNDGVLVLGTVPDFQFTDQTGGPFGMEDLKDRVWIGNFVFTRCLGTCPVQTALVSRLQNEFKEHPQWDELSFVSFTVDPEYDSPDVLLSYSKKHGADREHWKFLTGERDAIWVLSKEGFKLAVGDDPNSTNMPIFHSPQLILVDRQGKIRGYFDSGDEKAVRQLKESLELVLAESTEKTQLATTVYPFPEDLLDTEWLAALKDEQLATKDQFEVYHDFQFTDKVEQSGITFENKSVDYACKINIAAHYDHGNGIAVADIDGDGLLDIYLTTQIGANQLWRNLGAGRFEQIWSPETELADRIGVAASFADTDNDGDQDLFTTTLRGGNYFFENDGAGKFTDRTSDMGVEYNGHSSTGVFFDYDRDGMVDLFLCNVGVFTKDKMDAQGIYPPMTDAFAGHLKPERAEQSILYKNLGGDGFRDVTDATGLVDKTWCGDAAPIDINEDGWPDLFALNMQGHDEIYINVEGEKFEKKSREFFPKTSWGSMGVQVFDFDNNGKMDIYITDMHSDMSVPVEVADEKLKSTMIWPESFLRTDGISIFGNTFFANQGGGKFKEISDSIGAEHYWPWGLSSADFNADGFVDVFVAASMNYPFRYCVNKLLINNKGKRFLDSEFILGVEPRRNGRIAKANFVLDPNGADRNHQLVKKQGIKKPVEVWGAVGSRGSVVFDVDNDGDLDIITSEFNDGPMVLISDLSDRKEIQWLKISLTGKKSNRNGIGATVEVHVRDAVYTKVNDGRSGYLSQSVIPLYFGLGELSVVDKIVVKWPTGAEQVINGPIESNQLLEVRQK